MSVGVASWRGRFGRTAGAVIWLLAAGASASTSTDATGCQIQVKGSAYERWRAEAARVAQDMESHGWSRACSELSIEARGEHAVLTFVTSDGRSARRELSDPRELLPTAQALSVSLVSVEEPLDPTNLQPAGPHAAPRRTSDSAPPEATSPAVAPAPLDPLFGTQACVRSGADRLLSPCMNLTASLPVAHWELGLLGRYEMRYFSLGASTAGPPDASAIALGAFAGQLRTLGSWNIRYGLAGMIAGLRDGNGNDDSDEAESRLGGFGGLSWPARGHVALRAEAMLEWVTFSRGTSRRNAAGHYSVPWWAVTSSLGIEIR
ncbi:MAG TPA: hypothetical protein VJN18_24550 [Polyangiaceae bacterium]|nr:hypothetical protein [Polyangiaceae bacterium]